MMKMGEGKMWFQGLQYMALEIPNNYVSCWSEYRNYSAWRKWFFGKLQNEWLKPLCQLIEDADLRTKVGSEARKTVEKQYSVEA